MEKYETLLFDIFNGRFIKAAQLWNRYPYFNFAFHCTCNKRQNGG